MRERDERKIITIDLGKQGHRGKSRAMPMVLPTPSSFGGERLSFANRVPAADCFDQTVISLDNL
jgi:hypothetical protein